MGMNPEAHVGWKPDMETCTGTVLSVTLVPLAGDWMVTFIAIAQGGSSMAKCGLGDSIAILGVADAVELLPPHATAASAAVARTPSVRPTGLGSTDMLSPPLEGPVTMHKPA